MSDRFTADKLAWLEQVAIDAGLSPLARVIAMILAVRYLNRETGDAWPSVETLASDAGLKSTNPVRVALRSLENRGHLAIQWSTGGKGQTSRFRPILKPTKPFTDVNPSGAIPFKSMKGMDTETLHRGEGYGAKPFTDVNPLNDQTLHGGEQYPSFSERKPFTAVKGNPIEEPIEEPIERESISPTSRKSNTKVDDEEFETFWRAYPRREAKGAARRAYEKARKSVSAETILQGAERYARERTFEDPKFTKHPATWLNGECWGDEPRQPHLIAPGAGNGTYGNEAYSRPKGPAEQALDWIARHREEKRNGQS
jgi:hypothetical protein